MKILGLTGDIASGKSSVAQILAEKGAPVLDADLLVRELYSRPDFAALLAGEFGDILDENGVVSREKLGALVFETPAKLHELEAIVHPAVSNLRAQKLATLRENGARVAVLEAVKLLESGQGRICDAIWCLVASPETQKRRLIENRGLSEGEAKKRLGAQPSRALKSELAGQVPLVWIPNDGSRAELAAKVQTLWREFGEKA